MAWRATVTRCGRLGIVWAITLQEHRPDSLLLGPWATWSREDGGPYAIGTERHALAKAARIVRRRERKDAWEAEARARATIVRGGRPIVLPQVPDGPAPGALPNPDADRHRAFLDDRPQPRLPDPSGPPERP